MCDGPLERVWSCVSLFASIGLCMEPVSGKKRPRASLYAGDGSRPEPCQQGEVPTGAKRATPRRS